MTNEQFNALVARLEEQAIRHPFGYKLKVFLLALLGYGYLGLMLTILLALFVAMLASIFFLKAFAIKFIIPMAVFLWVVVRSMWIRITPPEGTFLKRREAPQLFTLVNDLRRRLHAPQFHHILITDEFNAAVVQVPRLGLFGWYRNYLLIGLPLMKSLTHVQFKAVLAHEFGHLAGGHGRLSNWLYRLRMSWSRLLDVLEEENSSGSFLFRPFFNWYTPYFNAYSFPLARANEYEADAAAARLESPRALAEALTSVHIIGSYLDQRFWPQIHRQADEMPQPAFAPYARLGDSLVTGLAETDASTWLEDAMTLETGVDDTHPSLADRLKALGEVPCISPPASRQAADTLLGESLERLTSIFDRRWHEDIQPSWEQRHQEVQQSRSRLAELDAQIDTQETLSLQDAYDRANLTETYGEGTDAAFEQFEQLHSREPDDTVLAYELGQRLLQRDNDEGFELVVQAIETNEDLIESGCELLRDHCLYKEREEEARSWHQRMVERARLLQAAQQERDVVLTNDTFEHHGLPDEEIADLRQQLQAVNGVGKVYLVRKKVKYMPEHPCYVLGYTIAPWWRLCSKSRAAQIQQSILESVQFPGESLVLNVGGENYRFGRKLRFRRGSRII